mgnify:CR=1 FL=1
MAENTGPATMTKQDKARIFALFGRHINRNQIKYLSAGHLDVFETRREGVGFTDPLTGRRMYDCFTAAGCFNVSRRNPEAATSARCASSIGASMRMAGFVPTRHHFPKHPWADEENAVHWHDNLVVLHRTTLPAVLFEAGVIKHRDEELQLSDPERMARMADAIATGVAACLYAMPR